MGCDVHAVVEYRRHDESWWAGQPVWLPRNYALFSRLAAGVRGWHPRGLDLRNHPKDISAETVGVFTWFVTVGAPGPGVTTGTSVSRAYVEERRAGGWNIREWNEDRVYSPDLHSFSWVTRQELLDAIVDIEFDSLDESDESDGFSVAAQWYAVNSFMHTMETQGHETRLVFGFDS